MNDPDMMHDEEAANIGVNGGGTGGYIPPMFNVGGYHILYPPPKKNCIGKGWMQLQRFAMTENVVEVDNDTVTSQFNCCVSRPPEPI